MRNNTKCIKLGIVVALCLVLSCLLGACTSKRVTKELEQITMGVDVAKYQGTIDWQTLAGSGIDFAMIRIGYRGMSDGVINADSNALYNLQQASKTDIALGVYFFSTAVSPEEAVEEAQWVAGMIEQYPITYPVAYDCENYNDPDSRQYGLTKEERSEIALAFLETIEKLGYEGMFYASKNEMENDQQWNVSKIERKYKIWAAQYPELPYPQTQQSSYSGKHHMWQYSMEGKLPGISQPVDLNIAYFGYDGVEPAKKDAPIEEVRPDPEALMEFHAVNEQVTAKDEINLRDIPSQDTDSKVMDQLQNGEIAQRVAFSDSGWSKLIFEGQTYYAVSSYLTTDLSYTSASAAPTEDDGIQTQFAQVNEQVTAKDKVNLRALPSVEHEDAVVIAQLLKGDTATRVGISDNGWSKLVYNGKTCYAVSNYLIQVTENEQSTLGDPEIQTQFEPMNDLVTAKVEVNLRSLPSVEDPNCKIVAKLYHGDVITRTGINYDVGWSQVNYNGQTLYCVSSYLEAAE